MADFSLVDARRVNTRKFSTDTGQRSVLQQDSKSSNVTCLKSNSRQFNFPDFGSLSGSVHYLWEGGGGCVKIWKFPSFFRIPPKISKKDFAPPPPQCDNKISQTQLFCLIKCIIYMLEVFHWLHVNVVIKILEYGYTCKIFWKIIDT